MVTEQKPLRQIDLKLLSNLMKNSKRSDRELSRILRVSQPTVSRIRSRLEKEGYIKEYTVMPDFVKLGYSIMALTFSKLRKLSLEELEKARAITREFINDGPSEIVLFDRGMGLGFDRLIVSFHKTYSSYKSLLDTVRRYPFVESCDSFLIDLNDPINFRSLTFSTLAKHIVQSASESSP